jgi:small-conductance mechanosensitive channel
LKKPEPEGISMILETTILGNTLYNYLYFAAVFAISIGISFLIKYVIIDKLIALAQRTTTRFDDAIVSFLSSIKFSFYIFVSLYIALQFLTLNEFTRRIIDAIFIVYIIYQVIQVIHIFIDFFLDKKANGENGQSIDHVKDIIQLILRVSFWVVGVLFVLSNIGINITSLVAGLGIGGIAVALAVQSILGDLFSYFAIAFDRPFIKGDLIVVGEHTGIIEKVGIKTTRIRALQGEEIIMSNSELTSSRIQNFKNMEERRIIFSFGVLCETPLGQLEKIPQLVRDIITPIEMARFERAHLSTLGDSAYIYEVAYLVQSADYSHYMDTHQMVLFGILKVFAEEQIEFAYPTSTVHLSVNNVAQQSLSASSQSPRG